MSEQEKPKNPNVLLLGVGSVLTSMIASGLILGFLVDWYFGTTPIFMLALGALGFVGGLLKVLKMLTHPGMF